MYGLFDLKPILKIMSYGLFEKLRWDLSQRRGKVSLLVESKEFSDHLFGGTISFGSIVMWFDFFVILCVAQNLFIGDVSLVGILLCLVMYLQTSIARKM